MISTLIKNVRIVDGTGAPWFRGDVAIKNDIIFDIGTNLLHEADVIFDGKDMILTPGFIDIHAHSDFSLPGIGLADSKVLQGVTTDIGGNCGISPAPIKFDKLDLIKKYTGFLRDDMNWDWTSFGDFLSAVEGSRPTINFACLVGHGTLRVAVMGFDDRKPTSEEMDEMKTLLRKAMEDGAFGISTGLIYPPGCYADTEELIELVKEIAPYGGFYETHMRDESDNVMKSLDESALIGKNANVPVQVAHHKVVGKKNWGKSSETIAKLEAYRDEGIDIVCDQYPYTASSTTLTTILPQWALAGGVDKLVERLNIKETREKLRKEVLDSMQESLQEFSDILISSVRTSKNKVFEGMTVEEAAVKSNKEPVDFAFDLIIEEDAGVAAVTFGMDEDDVRYILSAPFTMVGSDGSAMSMDIGGKPHPRTFGTFTKVLEKYALEEKLISFEEAVRKMTSLPASRMKFINRGLIKTGYKADLVLISPDELKTYSDYKNPQQGPSGIKKVWVNGILAANDGKLTGARPGQVIRHE
jgi:N-acyl-D-amino-acid deacylase